MSNRNDFTSSSPFPKHLIRPLLLNEENTNIPENEEPEADTSGPKHGPGPTDVVRTTSTVPGLQILYKESMVNFSNFISLSRDLKDNSSFKNSPPAYRIVLLEILLRATWEKTTLDHKGTLFQIEPGQLWVSIRQLAEWCGNGVSKNAVARAISRFCLVGFVRQEVRHTKLLITVTMPSLWKNKNESGETGSETEVGQMWDTNKEDKKIRSKKKKIKKEKPTVEKTAYREKVFLTSEQYQTLLSNHEQTFVDAMLDELNAYKMSNGKEYDSDFHTMQGAGWVLKKCKKENQTSTAVGYKANEEWARQVYEKYPEMHETKEISLGHDYLEFRKRAKGYADVETILQFSENGFREQVQNNLRKHGAPLERISNI